MDCPCSHSRSGLKMRASSQKIDATLQGIPVSSPEMIFDGSVDEGSQNAYNDVNDELVKRFPASNIAPSEAQEFYRVVKIIKSSLYFSSESRLESCLATQCFQRIFSIPVSERDFCLKTNLYNLDASDVFKPETMPNLTLTNKKIISLLL